MSVLLTSSALLRQLVTDSNDAQTKEAVREDVRKEREAVAAEEDEPFSRRIGV